MEETGGRNTTDSGRVGAGKPDSWRARFTRCASTEELRGLFGPPVHANGVGSRRANAPFDRVTWPGGERVAAEGSTVRGMGCRGWSTASAATIRCFRCSSMTFISPLLVRPRADGLPMVVAEGSQKRRHPSLPRAAA